MCLNSPILLRQGLVLAESCLNSFGSGIALAHPGVLNAAILSPNATDIRATVDQASWIASIQGFFGLLGFFIFSPLFQMIGRKPVNILLDIVVVASWVILYYSQSIAMMMFAKSVQGLAVGGYIITAVTTSEFTHRKSRGLFLTMNKIALSCGSLFCHSLALVWNWRVIGAVACLPSILNFIIFCICPESPAFYALKGRFQDCEKSFIWFHGDSEDSRQEMKLLILAQMERLEKDKNEKELLISKLLKKFLRRDFLIPFFIATLATFAVDASGRYFLIGYIPQIMIELTGEKYIGMYCSIIFDCLMILTLFISTIVIRIFKRRTVLLRFGAASIALMFAVCLSEVIKKYANAKFKWVTTVLILLHSSVSTIGLIPAAFTVTMEIFPLDHRGMGSLTAGVAFTLFYAITMKITPLMIEKIGISGTYLVFGICVTFCLTILYFILPETKDKSLQEIEDEIKRIKRSPVEIELMISNETENRKDID